MGVERFAVRLPPMPRRRRADQAHRPYGAARLRIAPDGTAIKRSSKDQSDQLRADTRRPQIGALDCPATS